MDRALTIFIHVWIGVILLANVLGVVGQFYLRGFDGGISYMQETYSPLNILNFVVTVVFLSPAIGAYYWRRRRRDKRA